MNMLEIRAFSFNGHTIKEVKRIWSPEIKEKILNSR